jgi:type II secretory pathway pseudopilin PulG
MTGSGKSGLNRGLVVTLALLVFSASFMSPPRRVSSGKTRYITIERQAQREAKRVQREYRRKIVPLPQGQPKLIPPQEFQFYPPVQTTTTSWVSYPLAFSNLPGFKSLTLETSTVLNL